MVNKTDTGKKEEFKTKSEEAGIVTGATHETGVG
jgi:hypothetical protein